MRYSHPTTSSRQPRPNVEEYREVGLGAKSSSKEIFLKLLLSSGSCDIIEKLEVETLE